MNVLTPKVLNENLIEGQLYVTKGGYGDADGTGGTTEKNRQRIVKIVQVGNLGMADQDLQVKAQMVAAPFIVLYYTIDGRIDAGGSLNADGSVLEPNQPSQEALAIADKYTPEKYPDAI